MSSSLRDQIRKRQPFDSPEQEAFLNLLRTTDWLIRDVELVLKPARLSSTQYNVLRILRGAGEALSCGEIAARMITREPDMTRLLDRLEKRGLIARARDTEDRRIVHTHITAQGLELLAVLDDPVRNMHRQQLDHLGETKLGQLSRLLEEARERKQP